MKEVESLLGNDEDLVKLYLTRLLTHYYEYNDMTLWWHELHIFSKEMTFSLSPVFFESYYADFEEIVAEIKTVKVDLNMKSCCYIHNM